MYMGIFDFKARKFYPQKDIKLNDSLRNILLSLELCPFTDYELFLKKNSKGYVLVEKDEGKYQLYIYARDTEATIFVNEIEEDAE